MFLALLAVALSGCTEGGSTGEGEDTTGTTTPRGAGPGEQPPGQPESNATYPREAFWNNCPGFQSAFLWVGENERFESPPEWEPDETDGYLYDLLMFGLECERFSLGPFERSVKMLLDTAGVNGVPDSCWRHNATISFDTLQTIWVNDTEVVQYLRDTYGMLAYYADIQTAWEPVGGTASEYVWTMTHEDGSESWFRTVDNGEYTSAAENLYRWFWFPPDGGVAYLDWQEEDANGNHQTYGHAEPPLSMADWHTDFATTGGTFQDLDASGQITMFRDVLCQDEIS